jgi:hypothetical protein
MTTHGRSSLLPLAAGALALSLTGQAIHAPARSRPRPGGVVVVASNLKEAFDHEDVARHGDMKVYVRRLLAQVPQAPDVLLLQEVSLTSVEVVARLLRKETGIRYRVAVAPLRHPWSETETRIVDQETGILVNAKTMRKASEGGFVKTAYPRRVAAAGLEPHVRKNAFVTLRHVASGTKMTVASIHLVQRTFFRTDAIAHEYKAAWGEQLAEALQREARSEKAASRTMGGDFNATRALRGDDGTVTSHSPLLQTLQDHDYADAVWDVTKMGGPDFVFTSGRVLDAGYDATYDPSSLRESSPRFYSDHRFRWAQLDV